MNRRTISRVFSVSAAVCAALFAFGTLAQAADLTPQEKALIPLAKKEGAVTIINPQFSDLTANNLGPAFIKRYGLGSNFKFHNLRKGTGQVVSQVRQEILAGKHTVDVIAVSAPGFFFTNAFNSAMEFTPSAVGTKIPSIRK